MSQHLAVINSVYFVEFTFVYTDLGMVAMASPNCVQSSET